MTVFDSDGGDFDRAHTGVTSLSEDFSEWTRRPRTKVDARARSDEGSVDEEDTLMPGLMDPSDSEDSKDDENEPTLIFTPGNDAYTTTFASVTPSTILSTSGAVMSYSRPDYFHSAFEELIKNMNGLDRAWTRRMQGQTGSR